MSPSGISLVGIGGEERTCAEENPAPAGLFDFFRDETDAGCRQGGVYRPVNLPEISSPIVKSMAMLCLTLLPSLSAALAACGP
jgi:hypothetical protein